MSTKATLEIISRPNFHVHIYEDVKDDAVWADISSGQFHLSIVLAVDRDAWEDTLAESVRFSQPLPSERRTERSDES